MDYPTAVDHLLALADYERMAGRAAPQPKYDLRRMEALVGRLGHPERCAPVVHVAGTKGKGSTAAMVASVLHAARYRTGLFTSPHLHTFRERIRLGLQPVTEGEFASLVECLWPYAEGPTLEGGRVSTFEFLVAMAFHHFQRTEVDTQVLEVGLGGRLDATNVAQGAVCAITHLSLDHTDILGSSIEEIAWEKAGVIKNGAVVISAPQPPGASEVIRQVCQEKGAPLRVVGRDIRWERRGFTLEGQAFTIHTPTRSYDLWLPLLGQHQLENAGVALGVLEALQEGGPRVPPRAVRAGLRHIQWPGRLEVLSRDPLVVVDGAHNPYSVARLTQAVREDFGYRRLLLVMGCSSDKDLEGMVQELAPLTKRVFCGQSRHPRALRAEMVYDAFVRRGVAGESVGSVDRALRAAMEEAAPGDLVLVTGSLFVVAEAIEVVRGITPELYPELKPRAAI